jgi:hypothetical protein
MSVAFAKTLIRGPEVVCLGEKKAQYKVQMAESHTGAGETFDVSAEFDFVHEVSCGISGAVADLGYVFAFEGGTYNATEKGYPAATVKIAAHRGLNGGGGAAPLDPSDGVDLKAINDLIVTVYGH